MSGPQITLLGAVAGFTIYLGLPLGRMRNPAPKVRALLNAVAIGILIFLLWDVLTHAWDPIDAALSSHRYGSATGNAAVFFGRFVARRARRPRSFGPGAATAGELASAGRPTASSAFSRFFDLSMLIAVGIGLHNFAEGLAIGNSAAQGQLQLAILLIIGFGLHNATEGFGIVAPLAAEGRAPTWTRLALLGLVGGGPTFLGTVIGQHVVNDALSIGFLTLAAGSILYVVIELMAVARRTALKELTTWGLLLGIVLGFITDAVV